MTPDPQQPIDLEEAQEIIFRTSTVQPVEEIPLAESLGRFPLQSLKALEPLPGYDQSLRDGFAVAGVGDEKKTPSSVFRVVDEVAAGDTRQITLHPGEAVRIMTGGLLPRGCQAVVPQELCHCEGENVRIAADCLTEKGKGRFIHARGSEFARGDVLAAKGAPITPESQILLAGGGYGSLPVARKVRISFFCTGSELLSAPVAGGGGQKFSANNSLLQGLIRQNGCSLVEQRTVMDDPDAVVKLFHELGKSDSDILISTGGMGPGKFDLIEESFARVGGRPMYHSLRLRPGKSTLFGTLGNTLFFGLPGPPPAVHFLFNGLVRPAILALQGAKRCSPRKIRGILTREMHLPKSELPRLKGAVLRCEDGNCLVRPAGRGESANCYIFCPARRRKLARGEKVSLHLLSSSPCAG
ncbi:MAG: molybdopterin molybdotransferase MoeA [Thermodesulfobacteriota bacterium]